MADFVEYVYGSAETTTWGAIRASDGHPEPYKEFWVEIGNEPIVYSAVQTCLNFTGVVWDVSYPSPTRHQHLTNQRHIVFLRRHRTLTH